MLIACIMTGLCLGINAQKDYQIYLKSGIIETPQQTLQLKNDPALLQEQQFNGYYHVLLQFEEIPTIDWREELAAQGIQLLHYLPNYAYLAKISSKTDISGLEVRAALPILPAYKLSGLVSGGIYPAHAIHPDGIALQVIPFPGISAEVLFSEIQQLGYSPISSKNGMVTMHLPANQIIQLAAHPAIMYIETADNVPTPEGIKGRTLHGANMLSTKPGEGYDGSGIAISIGDDGSVNHLDFLGRLHDHTTYNFGNHGDMTAGLAIGSGNINPMGAGMATGAELHLFGIDNFNHLLNAQQNFEQYGTVITSTSYGEGCGGEYTASAQELDQQVVDTEELLHFFSAGNSSNLSCSPTYQNIQHPDGYFYGNITGGRKAAKNVLAIGNLNYNDELRTSSSRGPTVDGRIKPDLCTQGQGNLATDSNNDYRWGGGTSAASPVAAGASAMLYQAYKAHHQNELPSSSLIKAVLLNTATDLGRPGPDYDYGWGRMNVDKALEVIENQQHLSGAVSQASMHNFDISVPANTSELKVMVYWLDAAGSPLASKALVNDLDMEIEASNGTIYRPWMLNTEAHIDSLTAPARRGEDHVNNMEQVSILNPNAGTYTVKIKGNIIPQAPQSYHLVYYFEQDDIAVKYPRGGEGFVPGEYQVVRWDAFGNEGTFTLEYSLDGMNTWNLIANNIEGHMRYHDWTVPAGTFGKAFVRVSRNDQSATSENYFTILGQPTFDFNYVDNLTTEISWSAVPGADRYDVYTLGDKYMELVDSTTSTSMELPINLEESKWYSVRARKKTSLIGRRTVAQNYKHIACDAQINLEIQLDLYPQENYWEITDENGVVVLSGGPYNQVTGGTLLDIEKCLPYGCYDFTIYDSHGDGIEQGSYTLTDEDGNILAQGSAFDDKETHSFCLEAMPGTLLLNLSDLEHVTCTGGNDGSIIVQGQGGSGSYNYAWSNGATGHQLDNLSAGTYTVTLTDGVEEASLSVSVTEPDALSVNFTISDTNCGNSDGAVDVNASGGQAPYSYDWSNGMMGMSLDGLVAGTYTLSLTDQAGCTLTESLTIDNSDGFELDFSVVDVSCYGGNDGLIQVLPNGGQAPFEVLWSTGANTMTIENLSSGSYEATVTDRTGCTAVESVVVLENQAIELELSSTNITDDNLGQIELEVDGGITPYTFTWSNGANTQHLNDLFDGTYTVTVTDANGCTATASATITDPSSVIYCDAWGQNNNFEWIESIQFGPLNNISGNDDGYGDYTHIITPLERGQTYNVLLEPGHISTAYNEYWAIWIDWNADGDFYDDNELMFSSPGTHTPILISMTLPTDVEVEQTRMRIAMQFGETPDPCGSFAYGEVEDYSIEILSTFAYCDAGGESTNYEWIESVSIGEVAHISGDNNGYADFTEIHIPGGLGQTLPISLSPEHTGNAFEEYWSIWVDWNEDGHFDETQELAFNSEGSTTTIDGFIDIPADASPGLKRMRVSMKWGSSAEPCETFSWGETEDYTLEVYDSEGLIANSELTLENNTSGEGTDGGYRSQEDWGGKDPIFYPNPAQTYIILKHYSKITDVLEINIIDASGKSVQSEKLETLSGIHEYQIDIHHLPAGIYMVNLQQGQSRWQKKLVVVAQQ
jgi:hypothetical protein